MAKQKTFTLEEAHSLLPILRSLLKRSMDGKGVIEEVEKELQDLKHRILLSGGEIHDCPPAKRLIQRTRPAKKLLGDKAYDSADLRHWLSERGTRPVVPNRCNRKQPFTFDRKSYKQRHKIENAFCRLKDFRRIATRYDRLARNFLASVCLVAAIVWWTL